MEAQNLRNQLYVSLKDDEVELGPKDPEQKLTLKEFCIAKINSFVPILNGSIDEMRYKLYKTENRMNDKLEYDLGKTIRKAETQLQNFETGPMKSMEENNKKSAAWVQEEYSKLGNLRSRLEDDFKQRQKGMEETLMKFVQDSMNNFLIPEGTIQEDPSQLQNVILTPH